MRFRLYAAQTCWVLVPEFLEPPVETEIYAPLEFRGYIDHLDADWEELGHIYHSLRRNFFAVVPHDVVGRLWPRGIPASSPV